MRCLNHKVRVVDATTVWNKAAAFSRRVVACPFGCVVADESQATHLISCVHAVRARKSIVERATIAVTGSSVVSIGSKQHGVNLHITCVHGRVALVTCAMCWLGPAKCVLHITDSMASEEIALDIAGVGAIAFQPTMAISIAAHSPARWLTATWC